MGATRNSDLTEAQSAVLKLAARRDGATLDQALDRLTEALHTTFPHYTGVYIYWMDGPGSLVLRTHRGRPTEHTRIPLDRGICGRAAREKRTVIVDDVNGDPSYLACSLETKSEIVVPSLKGDAVLGEIDIDGDAAAAYGPADQRFLEQVAQTIAARL